MQEDRMETYEQDPLKLKSEDGTIVDSIRQEQKASKKLISKLVAEYNAHKKRKLMNFRFSPKGMSTIFGKF